MDAITDESPECRALLPAAASAFFQHFSPASTSTPSSLQHKLSLQATESVYKASLQLAMEMKKVDGGLALTRLRAISAPRAWTWKVVAPTSRELELSDVDYRIAVRLNLGLEPIDGAAALPTICPLCKDNANTWSIRADPWHFLSCKSLRHAEVNVRHDDVNKALYRCALMMGLTARLEPAGLDPKSDKRPDLLLTLPGRHIITDVAIVHPLAPGKVRSMKSHNTLSDARTKEVVKRKHYADLVDFRHYQLHPFVMETCGGMGPAAENFIDTMAEAGEAHLRMWAKEDIVRELLHSVAIAVQRGGAMAYLHGYDKVLHKLWTDSEAKVAMAAARSQRREEAELLGEDNEEEAEAASAA
jgi:hypothetical protein